MAIEKRVRSSVRLQVGIGSIALALCAAEPAPAQSATERASLSSQASQGSADSDQVAISGDGRFCAFRSVATDLVPGDTNAKTDIFVRDRWTGLLERVSVSTAGIQADDESMEPAISEDGRWVAFTSRANNLSSEVPAGWQKDVFLHDRLTRTTRIVTRAGSGGGASNGDCLRPRVSSDGRYVSFSGVATNLVAGTTTNGYQVFRRDMLLGTTLLVSSSLASVSANGSSWNGAISNDGRYVAFVSAATDLIAGDTNASSDCFRRDVLAGVTRRVSVSSSGVQATGSCFTNCSMSRNGRWIAFSSSAGNLAPGEFAALYDIFLHDTQAASTLRVSVNTSGQAADGNSYDPAVSDDGRFVAFHSYSRNLDPVDSDDIGDIFLRDMMLGATSLMSRGWVDGGNDASYYAQISADGSIVAFQSLASNLVTQDTNGSTDTFVRDTGRLDHTSFCGGTLQACPCGNPGQNGAGCENSGSTGGALLRGFGAARVSFDQLTLLGTGLPPATSAVLFQGTTRENSGSGSPFGDGLRCAGGTLLRLAHLGVVSGVASLGFGGMYGLPGGVATPIHTLGSVPSAGGVRTYQLWYRNAAPSCTSATFNLSNGVEVAWSP